ncbi:hypothetical protein ACP4OV_011784 [Aristida adscensionis]
MAYKVDFGNLNFKQALAELKSLSSEYTRRPNWTCFYSALWHKMFEYIGFIPAVPDDLAAGTGAAMEQPSSPHQEMRTSPEASMTENSSANSGDGVSFDVSNATSGIRRQTDLQPLDSQLCAEETAGQTKQYCREASGKPHTSTSSAEANAGSSSSSSSSTVMAVPVIDISDEELEDRSSKRSKNMNSYSHGESGVVDTNSKQVLSTMKERTQQLQIQPPAFSQNVPENSLSVKTSTGVDVATVTISAAPQKAKRKSSSPHGTVQGKNASADTLGMEANQCKMVTEHKNSNDVSPLTTPCLESPGGVDGLEAVLLKARDEKSNIERSIQIYDDVLSDEFIEVVLPCPKRKKLNNYEGRSKIVVPEFDDPFMQMAIGYMGQDFKKIKKLITAPMLDKNGIVMAIAKSLERWGLLLRTSTIPKEVSNLMDVLEDLKNNLSGEADDADPFSVCTLRSDEEHIQGHLKIAKNSHRSATLGLQSLKGHGTIRDKHNEARKKQQQLETKIEELEAALHLARSALASERKREAIIVESRTEYNEMVSEASEAVSNFGELLARGSTCLQSITELRLQLELLESCSIEGAEA